MHDEYDISLPGYGGNTTKNIFTVLKHKFIQQTQYMHTQSALATHVLPTL